MNPMQTFQLSDSVRLKSFTDRNFKTMRISVNLLMPLAAQTAAQYAILPALITRATRKYPSYTELGCRLAELYGAVLGSGVQKIGDWQGLGLTAGCIADQYALEGEDLFQELLNLLFDVLFDPLRDEAGLFPEDGFQQEKRQLLEQKDAEFSDKMVYAHQRCQELLFYGQRAGISRIGSRADILALKRAALNAAWKEIMKNARFEIFVLGNCQADIKLFQDRFAGLGTPHQLGGAAYRRPEGVQRVTEEQPVAQSKLSMAYRFQAKREERPLFMLLSAVLGEPTSSKLFQNVREKAGLCYYCDSALSWTSGALYIESGVDTVQLELAEEAIIRQVEAMRRGEVTEEELRCAKLYLYNSLRGVGDSLYRIEGWYLGRSFDQDGQTPEETMQALETYTVADIAKAAARLELAVVYQLKGAGGSWS